MRFLAKALLFLTMAGPVYAQDVHIWPVHGNVYILVGAGSNITFSFGKNGILLVDTGTGPMTDKVVAALRQFAREKDPAGPTIPIRFIINTSADADHVGGNQNIVESALFNPLEGGEVIIAQDNVLRKMAEAPEHAQPTHTYLTEQYKLNRYFNGEGVQVIHMPAAHSDGDSIVWFRFSDVISTGDVFTDSYPVINVEQGGTVNGVIDALNRVIDLIFPEFRVQGGTMLVPGHGRISDLTDIAYYRDMVTIVRDRVQDMIKRGMTLEQVKAAKLTADFDPVYDRPAGSAAKFVESVYRSLSRRNP
jgi:cyclase